MRQPKLILLNGPAGIGKTTLARMYGDDHPLALHVSVDDLIVMLGQWQTHEPEARRYVFEFTKALAAQHLSRGHDVVLPMLLTDLTHAEAFKAVADEQHATFYEFTLVAPKEEAVQRVMKRGTWGEPGLPPLTEADRPEIERLYDIALKALETRASALRIDSVEGDIAGTYQKMLARLES